MANSNLPLGARGIWIPASFFNFPDGTWTFTRLAAGNYIMRKTAGADTTHPSVSLSRAFARAVGQQSSGVPSVNAPQGGEVQTGGVFTGFDLVYGIGTDAMTAITPLMYQAFYKDNAAAVINSAPGGALSPTDATGQMAARGNPYVLRFAFATPYIIGNNVVDDADQLEITAVARATAVFDIYGVYLLKDDNK